MSFTEPGKPALITGKPAPDGQPDYRYLLMPIRLSASGCQHRGLARAGVEGSSPRAH